MVVLGVTAIVSNDVCIIFILKSVSISPISLPNIIRGFFTFLKEKNRGFMRVGAGLRKLWPRPPEEEWTADFRGFARIAGWLAVAGEAAGGWP
jgi:urea transporter